jgi:hypothetical protein
MHPDFRDESKTTSAFGLDAARLVWLMSISCVMAQTARERLGSSSGADQLPDTGNAFRGEAGR